MPDYFSNLAGLSAAFVKAQAEFPPIPRDKTVTVQTRTGGSYTFKYAPLDTILAAVRGPLSANGLAISQLLDGTDLVTLLLHSEGGVLSSRTPLGRDPDDTVQAYGSAITYLRRYAIQAMLGIAAEEDDDGNRASGNKVKSTRQHPGLVDGDPPPPDRPPLERIIGDGGLVGKVAVSGSQDFQIRETPDGAALPFRLKDAPNRAGLIVVAHDDLARALYPFRERLIGERVTIWGRYSDEEKAGKGGFVVGYKILHLSRIQTADWTLPAPDQVTPANLRETFGLPPLGPEDQGPAPGQVAAFSDEEAAAILAAELEEAGRA